MDEALPKFHRSPPGAGISSQRLAEYLVAGVVACAAIGVGIYLGVSTSIRSASSEQLLNSLNRSYLDVGDQIPDYELWDVATRERLSVAQLAAERPVLLLFVSRTCNACNAMSEYWERKVISELQEDIALICVYDDGDWYGDSSMTTESRLFPSARVVTTDREAQKESDGITATPTLVAINREGRIEMIATGFSRSIDSDLLGRLL